MIVLLVDRVNRQKLQEIKETNGIPQEYEGS